MLGIGSKGATSELMQRLTEVENLKLKPLRYQAEKKTNVALGSSEDIRYLNIVQGNKKNHTNKKIRIKLNKYNTTLENIAKIIDKSNLDITSKVKKISSNENCLIINSNILGLNGKISISVDGDDKLNQLLSFPGTNVDNLEKKQDKIQSNTKMRENRKAQCSILEVDGIKYYRESNHALTHL
uniref:Uncharacterized protein n=1 Tax=Glossina austeni TaxID=7395 RepID=A0A1A9UKN1_GLOAU